MRFILSAPAVSLLLVVCIFLGSYAEEIPKDNGQEFIIKGERLKQQVSRHSMDSTELKETTTSMGDPMNALTIFPGIERATGLTGNLVIRGLRPEYNRYYIDGMPVIFPVHFNGEHIVVSVNFIKGIDVYSSAFPVQYGGALGGVIDMTTVDDITAFSGLIDINMIANSLFFKIPIFRTSVPDENGDVTKTNKGYIMFGGRYNGIKYILDDLIYKVLHPKEKREEAGNFVSDYKLEYWDYQFKAHYSFDRHHSITLLGIGAGDKEFRSIDYDSENRKLLMFHNQGLSYNYSGDIVKNRLLVYNSLSDRRQYRKAINMMYLFELINIDLRTSFGSRKSRPYLIGVKDSFEIEWIKKHAQLRGEMEYQYSQYYFKGENDAGTNYFSIPTTNGSGMPYSIRINYPYSINVRNHLIGGYLDNRFTWGGFEFTAGARCDYLKQSNTFTIDPRGSVTYRFDTGTTIAGAGGMYSSFFQNNPEALFNEDPNFTKADYASPERSTHAAVSVEQKIDLFTLSLEGFHTYLRDLFKTYPHIGRDASYRIGTNSGRMRSYGLEFLARKEKGGGNITWFGWLSYSLTFAKENSGLFRPALLFLDPMASSLDSFGMIGAIYGNNYINENMFWWYVCNLRVADISGFRWINAEYERTHSLKLILGLVCGHHTLGARFQLNTSFPYTEIVTSYYYMGLAYLAVYNPKRNASHYPVNHRLDIQYDYKKEHDRGYIRFYIGVLDIFAPLNKTINGYKGFNPMVPYIPGKNPEGFTTHEKDGAYSALGGVIPYVGIEITF